MKNYVFLILYFCFALADGQTRDSTFIRLYKHNLIINPWFGVPQYDLQATGISDTALHYKDYVSNTRILVGVDLTYKDLSISVGFRTKLYANDANQFGKSKAGSLSMRYTHKRWAFEGRYANYSGFADASYLNSSSEALPFRKDLQAHMSRVATQYTFRAHKFSYGAAFNYSYRQLKSAWSPMVMAHAYGLRFKASNSVLDTHFVQNFREVRPFDKSRNIGIGIGPGLGGTVIMLKRFFLTGILFVGADLQSNSLSKSKVSIYRSMTVNPFVDFRCAMGYNINRFFTAVTLKNENFVFDMHNFDVSHSYTMLTFEVGYRFDAPRWLSRSYAQIAGNK